ncbi:FHA domain-containing protein [Edaphobacter modestus]|uniref:FHA domain-containing protein n=1 Tax=Edaphobacter modestus TaxID=388466 RepID=A0A4Q7YWP2_9BACT|nr:FHA domain-containing protein [Edaphobacter modestus]RZU42247.1 FHA domain-containing protein [Edaphobacter modestus]
MQVTLIRLDTSTQEATKAQIEIEDRVFFGRQLGSPLTLQGEALSRQHFALFIAEERLMIENLSGNGTSLNGEALTIKSPSSVQSGDVVEVPGYQIRVELQEALQNEEAEGTKVPVWQTYGKMALNFFNPLEVALLLCVIACICLFTYYVAT